MQGRMARMEQQQQSPAAQQPARSGTAQAFKARASKVSLQG